MKTTIGFQTPRRPLLASASFSVQSIRLSSPRFALACLPLLFSTPALGASFIVGSQNTVNHPTASFLYGPTVPSDSSIFDDSALINIYLRNVTTWEDVAVLASTFNPHVDPHVNPCPPLPYTFSQEVSSSTSWTKSFSTTESAQVTSSLGVEFAGIGAGLESAYSISYTVGSEVSKTNTVTNTQTLGPMSIPAGGRCDVVQRYYWATYSGTYDYFVDTLGPGGSYVYDVDWSVTVQYKNQLEPYVSGGTPCPEPGSMIATLCFLSSSLVLRRRATDLSATLFASP